MRQFKYWLFQLGASSLQTCNRKISRKVIALVSILSLLIYLTSHGSYSGLQEDNGRGRKNIEMIESKVVGKHPRVSFPALVDYPDVHVATSGNEDIGTGETLAVYYFWCGQRVFRFRNYLSVMSAIYSIRPSKIMLVHTHDLVVDDHRYNTWLKMLLDTVPNLITNKVGEDYGCDVDISGTIFGSFPDNNESSLFIGSSTVMTEFSLDLRNKRSLIGAARVGKDEGFLYKSKHPLVQEVSTDQPVCSSIEDFRNSPDERCVTIEYDIVPKDIWTLETPFGSLARTLVYGHPDLILPNQSFDVLTPRIAHYFFFGNAKFHYGNYLSVLSAIYVAGLETVYFHGQRPQGYFFDKLLKEENVTHIYTPEHKYVHNHRLKYLTHNADIGKLYVIAKYGGVTQDADIFWTRRVSDELLSYEAVVSFDWPQHGEFPEVFNLGLLMGKQNSFYCKALLAAMRDYNDDTVHHLAMQLPYKTYEHYPSSLHTDRHLQVICWLGKCHPSWYSDYIQPLSPEVPSRPFSWFNDTLAVHCTWPKPPEEMQSRQNLLAAEGLFAEIGRNILKKAGKL